MMIFIISGAVTMTSMSWEFSRGISISTARTVTHLPRRCQTESYPTSGTTLPDMEDINRDNTLSETESYYQYHVSLRPEDMVVGKKFHC